MASDANAINTPMTLHGLQYTANSSGPSTGYELLINYRLINYHMLLTLLINNQSRKIGQ